MSGIQMFPAALGGYFELAYPPTHPRRYPSARSLQSCRAGLHALLAQLRPTRLWLPRYLCHVMLAPLRALGITPSWYELTSALTVDPQVMLAPHDLLLYVNYFGLCQAQTQDTLQRFAGRVVLDHAQAWYIPPCPQALATLYSPRKFFGLPDGGLLVSQCDITLASEPADDTSIYQRTMHLLRRLADGPEAGYEAFRMAEASLADTTPQPMSPLTARLLAGADDNVALARRNENFHALHLRLGANNPLPFDFDAPMGPLCYPFLVRNPAIRAALVKERIFVPTYWPELCHPIAPDSIEALLVNYCLPLPCDQRYTGTDMTRLADRVLALCQVATQG